MGPAGSGRSGCYRNLPVSTVPCWASMSDCHCRSSLRPRQPGVIVSIDANALQSSLQRLRQATFDADVVVVMMRAVNAVHRVFGCSGAGIMFITESGQLSYVAASDEAGRQLEQAQAVAGQGPCYDSYVYAREV